MELYWVGWYCHWKNQCSPELQIFCIILDVRANGTFEATWSQLALDIHGQCFRTLNETVLLSLSAPKIGIFSRFLDRLSSNVNESRETRAPFRCQKHWLKGLKTISFQVESVVPNFDHLLPFQIAGRALQKIAGKSNTSFSRSKDTSPATIPSTSLDLRVSHSWSGSLCP